MSRLRSFLNFQLIHIECYWCIDLDFFFGTSPAMHVCDLGKNGSADFISRSGHYYTWVLVPFSVSAFVCNYLLPPLLPSNQLQSQHEASRSEDSFHPMIGHKYDDCPTATRRTSEKPEWSIYSWLYLRTYTPHENVNISRRRRISIQHHGTYYDPTRDS